MTILVKVVYYITCCKKPKYTSPYYYCRTRIDEIFEAFGLCRKLFLDLRKACRKQTSSRGLEACLAVQERSYLKVNFPVGLNRAATIGFKKLWMDQQYA